MEADFGADLEADLIDDTPDTQCLLGILCAFSSDVVYRTNRSEWLCGISATNWRRGEQRRPRGCTHGLVASLSAKPRQLV